MLQRAPAYGIGNGAPATLISPACKSRGGTWAANRRAAAIPVQTPLSRPARAATFNLALALAIRVSTRQSSDSNLRSISDVVGSGVYVVQEQRDRTRYAWMRPSRLAVAFVIGMLYASRIARRNLKATTMNAVFNPLGHPDAEVSRAYFSQLTGRAKITAYRHERLDPDWPTPIVRGKRVSYKVADCKRYLESAHRSDQPRQS
jgi:hypothetical protein